MVAMVDKTLEEEFSEGVYFDFTVGQCYTFEMDSEAEIVELYDAVDDEKVEELSYDEFRDIRGEVRRVPEEAVNDPVSYFNTYVAHETESSDLDIGFMFADMATKVVERE